jgi:VPDSG-CTERM motif
LETELVTVFLTFISFARKLCKTRTKISVILNRHIRGTCKYDKELPEILAGIGLNSAFSTEALNQHIEIMKLLKHLVAVAVLIGALTLSAKADIVKIGQEAFVPNNSPASNLEQLGNFVDTTGFVLCGNSDDGAFGNPITNPISVMAGAFLVIHYGKGNDGSAKGGGLEFYHVINGETSVDVPLFGTSPFGNGGISSIREFCPPGTQVPDSGTAAMLLGSALAGLGLVRRHLKR